MDAPEGLAAPESGITDDPEILALLDFAPVPRKTAPPGAWTPEAQRAYIARLAMTGSQGKACGAIGKDRGGATKLYNSPEGGSFRAAWHAAIELYQRRQEEKLSDGPPPALQPPTVDGRRKYRPNRWSEREEDPMAAAQDYEETLDSLKMKLLRSRRLYLAEIADCPGKRAAFEILTSRPIDWEKAKRLEQQADEPWKRISQRQPDMVLTAESGWSFGDIGYGEPKMAELRAMIDEHRAENGKPPIDWSVDDQVEARKAEKRGASR